jgi:hypothetical protein
MKSRCTCGASRSDPGEQKDEAGRVYVRDFQLAASKKERAPTQGNARRPRYRRPRLREHQRLPEEVRELKIMSVKDASHCGNLDAADLVVFSFSDFLSGRYN